MSELALYPTEEEINSRSRELFIDNAYPGRFAMQGLNEDSGEAWIAYGLTGRRPSSRNRICVDEGRGSIRTVAPGMSAEEMAAVESSELIYYQATKSTDGLYVVSNGAQTTYVHESIYEGADLETAVKNAPTVNKVNLSRYEPDTNFTPRITGVIDLREEAPTPFGLSIVRKNPESEEPIYETYTAPDVRDLQPGTAFAIQTYLGDGEPLPSFDQEPYPYEVSGNSIEIAGKIWSDLDPEKRVALLVQTINLGSQALKETCIVNSPAPIDLSF